jgi:hypothetical protein
LASYIEDFLNVVPPLEAVAGLRQTRVGPPLENVRQMTRTASLVEQLFKTFVNENDLTRSERREISFDAAKKLALLGLQALRFDTSSSASLLLQALQLDYHLLHPSIMMKGLRRMY